MSSSERSSWQNYYAHKKELEWRKWLHTLVYIDFRDETSVVKRFECFQYFIQYGLVPFVKSHKYIFRPGIHLANELANRLYKKSKDFREQPFYRIIQGKQTKTFDYDHYITVGIPKEDWEFFWKDWEWMTDFMDENYKNQYLIPEFVYNRLDLEHSEVTDILTQELEDDDDFEEHYIVPEQASEAIGQGKDRNSLY